MNDDDDCSCFVMLPFPPQQTDNKAIVGGVESRSRGVIMVYSQEEQLELDTEHLSGLIGSLTPEALKR